MSADQVAIIIPARHASTRYPGKPLARIRGATGEEKTLIQRSWEAARRVDGAKIYVATDSPLIRDEAERFGANVIMTSESCLNGTERCAEALVHLPFEPELVVNLQGDAPLTPAGFVRSLIDHCLSQPAVVVATPAIRCTSTLYDKLVAEEAAGRVGGTSAVVASDGRALYFSKRLIPYFDRAKWMGEGLPAMLHLGVYAYAPAALRAYAAASVCPLELMEGLEQLRFLDAGMRIDVVEVEAPAWEIWELNNPSDLPLVEAGLRVMGVA